MATVAVIGAGSFGTSVSWMLSKGSGHNVKLWSFKQEDADYINEHHRNPHFLKDCDLTGVVASSSLEETVDGAESVIIVTPSFAVRGIAHQLASIIDGKTKVVILSKGLDLESGNPLFTAVAEELGGIDRIAVLSGPNHAEELSLGMYSGSVVASTNVVTACYFQSLLSNDFFRIYASDDPIGVSLCGAAKNVVAIACGIARGSKLGDNAMSLLITRGVAEVSRLVSACGGKQVTCLGLAGVGDLNATCNSPHSRNGMYGETFAKTGISVSDYEKQRGMVVEGAHAFEPLLKLAAANSVDLPITKTVKALIEGEIGMKDAADILFDRPLCMEFDKA